MWLFTEHLYNWRHKASEGKWNFFFSNRNFKKINKNGHWSKALANEQIFFARKFDPLINQQIINQIDQMIFGMYTTGDYTTHTPNFVVEKRDKLSEPISRFRIAKLFLA